MHSGLASLPKITAFRDRELIGAASFTGIMIRTMKWRRTILTMISSMPSKGNGTELLGKNCFE